MVHKSPMVQYALQAVVYWLLYGLVTVQEVATWVTIEQ